MKVGHLPHLQKSSPPSRREDISWFNARKVTGNAKEKAKATKEEFDDPETKALSDKSNKLQAELNKIKADQDEVYNNLPALCKEHVMPLPTLRLSLCCSGKAGLLLLLCRGREVLVPGAGVPNHRGVRW